MYKIRKCDVCGKDFQPNSSNHRMCSPECKKKGQILSMREFRKAKKTEKAKKRNLTKERININAEARKHNMSYGQYVAWKGV